MVTIDDILRNVPDFNGDVQGNRIFYEQAAQGLARIKKEEEVFKTTLKAKTGFDDFNLPEDGGKEVDFTLGDAEFKVKSEKRIKRPAYMQAVEPLERLVQGMGYLAGTGRTIAYLAKKDQKYYVDAAQLEEDFAIMVHAILIPEVKHTITHTAKGGLEKLAQDPVSIKEIRVPEDMSHYKRGPAEAYVLMQALKPRLEGFVKAYEAQLSAVAIAKATDQIDKTESLAQVGGGEAYSVKTSKAKGTDWFFVVRQLYQVPNVREKCVGELNILADQDVSIAEKRKLPYELWQREVNGEPKTYVSLNSVYERIQELKGAETLEARRKKIEGVKVV